MLRHYNIAVFTDNLYLLVKGAETALFGRLAEGDQEMCERHITDYALVCVVYRL